MITHEVVGRLEEAEVEEEDDRSVQVLMAVEGQARSMGEVLAGCILVSEAGMQVMVESLTF